MHNGAAEPVSIDPYMVQQSFFDDKCSALIGKAMKFDPLTGMTLKAIIIDSFISETTITPALTLQILVEKDGVFSDRPISDFFHMQDVVCATGAILKNASEDMIHTLEYLTERLPLKNLGRYIRTHHMEGAVLLGMEYLEGWIETLEGDIFEFPDATANRCQICTYLLPDNETAHEQVSALILASQNWDQIKGAWPHILGNQFCDRINVAAPNFGTYPSPA